MATIVDDRRDPAASEPATEPMIEAGRTEANDWRDLWRYRDQTVKFPLNHSSRRRQLGS